MQSPAQLQEKAAEIGQNIMLKYMQPRQENPYQPTAMKVDVERYGGLLTNPILAQNPALMEQAAARTQSFTDRLWNDTKVTGMNFGGMFTSVFTGTFDMLKDMDLSPTKDSLTSKIAEEMAAYSNKNANFANTWDFENPTLGAFVPFASSKGLGEIVKSVAFGMGAMAGLVAEEVAITYLTGGAGTIPGLAAGIRNILRTSKTISQIADASISTASLLNKSKQVSASMRAADYGLRGLNLSKDLARHYISAFGEAEFEAQESREAVKLSLMKDYFAKNGYVPEAGALSQIEQIAENAHDARFALNAGMLMMTNHAMLKTIFKPFHKVTGLSDKATELGYKPFLNDLTNIQLKKTTKLTSDFFTNNKVGRFLKEPMEKVYPALSKYLKSGGITWSEGFEEGYQFLVGKSTDNYFTNQGNSTYNAKAEKALFEDVSNLLKQMYRDKGELTSSEGIKSILSGIIAGSGQQAVSNLYGNFKYEKGKGLVNLSKEARLDFESKLDETNKGLDDFLKEAVNRRSIKETPQEVAKKAKASYTIDQHQDSSKDPLTNELLRSQARFVNFIDGIKLGQDKIIIDILDDQAKGLTVEQFNNLTGAKVETPQQRDKLIADVKQDIASAKSSLEKANALFRNPFAGNTVGHSYYEEMKDALVYHDYMAGQVSDLILKKEEKASSLSKDNLVQGIVTSDKIKVINELKALTTLYQEQLTSFTNLGEGQKLSPQSKKEKALLEKRIQAIVEISAFEPESVKSIKKALKLVPLLKGYDEQLKDQDLESLISDSYGLAKAKSHLETHIGTFDKLSKVNSKNLGDLYASYKFEADLTNQALKDIIDNTPAKATEEAIQEVSKGDEKTAEILKQEVEDTKKTPEEVIKTVPEPESGSTEGKIPKLKDLDPSQVKVGMAVLLGNEPVEIIAVHPNDIIVVEYTIFNKQVATFRFFEDNWAAIPNDSPMVPKEPQPEPEVIVPEPPVEEDEDLARLQASIESKLIRPFTMVVKNADGTYSYVKQKELTEEQKAHIKKVHAEVVREIAQGTFSESNYAQVEIDNSADGLFAGFPAEKGLIIDNNFKSTGLEKDGVVFFERKPKEMFKVSENVMGSLSMNTKVEIKRSNLLYDVVQVIKDKPSEIAAFLREFYNPGYESLGFERLKDFVISYFDAGSFKPSYVAEDIKVVEKQPMTEFNQPFVFLENGKLEYVTYFHNQWYSKVGDELTAVLDEKILEELEDLKERHNWKASSFMVAQGKSYTRHIYYDVYTSRADDLTSEFVGDLRKGLEDKVELSSLANQLQNKYWIGSSVYDVTKATGKSLSFFIEEKGDSININLKVGTLKVGSLKIVGDKVIAYDNKNEALPTPVILERVAMTNVTLDKFLIARNLDRVFPVLSPLPLEAEEISVPLSVDAELVPEEEVEPEIPDTPFGKLLTDGLEKGVIENGKSFRVVYYVKDDISAEDLQYLRDMFDKPLTEAKINQLLGKTKGRGLKRVDKISFRTERYMTESLLEDIEKLKEICK
jgi:hypothetical protein